MMIRSITATMAKQQRVPTGAPKIMMSVLPTSVQLTISFTIPPTTTVRMGRFTMPWAWSMELQISMTQTKMAARPSVERSGPAMEASKSRNRSLTMGVPREKRPTPMGRQSSVPTRSADSEMRLAPSRSCRARQPETGIWCYANRRRFRLRNYF